MNLNDYESIDRVEENQAAMQSRIDDRQGLLGLIALILLAIPALLIRYLFPDLDPMILAGLGLAVYSVYAGMMVLALSSRAGQEEPSPKPVPVAAGDE